MGTPAKATCTINAWTRVAQNVTSALVRKWSASALTEKSSLTSFYHTSVATGGAVPTGLGAAAYFKEDTWDFNSSSASDLYIYAGNGEGVVEVTT